MTRAAVIADTHHSFKWLPFAAERLGKVDLLFHLGDLCADAQTVSKELGGVPYYAVRGNNDTFCTEPKLRFEYVENARIMLTHGDEFYNTYHLAMRAEENHCSAVLFGHTHVPLLQASGDILILNPGSLSLPRRGSKPSCALLEVEGKDIHITMISL